MLFRRVLDGQFLFFQYYALEGDTYNSEGYVFFDHDTQQIRWYEFNNGQWPVRTHTGRAVDQSLVLEEHSFGRHMRLVFEFLDHSTIHMTEAHLRDDQIDVYVDMIFKRD